MSNEEKEYQFQTIRELLHYLEDSVFIMDACLMNSVVIQRCNYVRKFKEYLALSTINFILYIANMIPTGRLYFAIYIGCNLFLYLQLYMAGEHIQQYIDAVYANTKYNLAVFNANRCKEYMDLAPQVRDIVFKLQIMPMIGVKYDPKDNK